MPMNSSLASADFSKGRRASEPSNEPLLHQTAQNLIMRAWSWLGKVVSFAFACVLMIFFIGFAAGLAWQSYRGAARKAIASWSGTHPYHRKVIEVLGTRKSAKAR
jgi:hypothetical protein